MEFITRGDRRRVWALEQKRAIALESLDPAGAPSDVARRYGISSGLLVMFTALPVALEFLCPRDPVEGEDD